MTSAPMTLRELQRYLTALPKALEKSVVRGIRTGAERALPLAVSAGDAKGVFDTGEYRRKWKTRNLNDGASIDNTSGHGDIIEKGRRKGRRMPPRRVISRWAERKLGLSPEEAKRAAYPIARAIARRGIPGRHVVRDMMPEIIKVVLDEVKAAISQALHSGGGGH